MGSTDGYVGYFFLLCGIKPAVEAMDSESISVYPMAAWCIWHMRRCYKPIVRSCVHSQRRISSRGCDRTQDIVRVHGDYRCTIERKSSYRTSCRLASQRAGTMS